MQLTNQHQQVYHSLVLINQLKDSESVESSGESSEEQPRNLEDRGLIEDLLINLIRDMITNQINSILGITTTTTPCGGLLGGGLLCP